MLLVLLFGIGMLLTGGYMIVAPMKFSNGLALFSQKPWFHAFEISSRLILGLLFLSIAKNTSYPGVFTFIGWLLCFVSVFLLLIGSSRHKRFALLTSNIGKNFRVLGFVAVTGGASIIYLGLT